MSLTRNHKFNEKIKQTAVLSDDYVITAKFILHREKKIVLETLTEVCDKYHIIIKKIADLFIEVIGAIRSFEKLFSVDIVGFSDGNKTYHSYTGDIVIPPQLNFVADVLGLCDLPCAAPYYKVLDQSQKAVNLTSFTPLQVASMYKIPQATGNGQSIAIIELGGGYVLSSLNTYFKSLGLSKFPNIISVSVDGGINNPNDPSGASIEVVLDIEIAGAIANASNIIVYFAPNSLMGFYNAISKAINDTLYKPSIISISWGSAEVYWSLSTLNMYNNLFATAVAKGINIFCASGDHGSTDGVNNSKQNVDFPASSPNVVACGGTTLMSSTGGSITNEIVWNNGGGLNATGGGYSAVFTKPIYQQNVPTQLSNYRGVPDIAGDADPHTGYRVLVGTRTYVVGGTSAVSPLWAGITARLNQLKGTPVGYLNPWLYSAKPYNDIVMGNNGAYTAVTGWDACTGNGTPNGNKLAALVAPSIN